MKTPHTVLSRMLALVGLGVVLAVAGLWATASEGARTAIPALTWLGGGAALAATVVLVARQARRIGQLDRQLQEAKTEAVQGAFGHYLDPQVVERLVESANLVDSLGARENSCRCMNPSVARARPLRTGRKLPACSPEGMSCTRRGIGMRPSP